MYSGPNMLKLFPSTLSCTARTLYPTRCYSLWYRLLKPFKIILTSTTSTYFIGLRYVSQSVSRQATCNHYKTLGLQENSSQSEIKSAYYRMSKIHHPLSNQNRDL